jgi:hypothetical protein
MIERGVEVDNGSIVKTFNRSYLAKERRYSSPEVVSVKCVPVQGAPVHPSDFHNEWIRKRTSYNSPIGSMPSRN